MESPSHRAQLVVGHLLLASPRASSSHAHSPAAAPSPSHSPSPPPTHHHPRSPAARATVMTQTVAASAVTHTPPAASASLPYSTPTPVSATDPHLLIRRACASDFAKGHVELLSQLTTTGDISYEAYAQRLADMQRCGNLFHLLVIEDTSLSSPSPASDNSSPAPSTRGVIVASATLVCELKLVHGCGQAGHIEDVVVREGYRGKNLGGKIIHALHEVAKAMGCYKVMLDCKESNAPFYSKLGYFPSEMHMRFNLA